MIYRQIAAASLAVAVLAGTAGSAFAQRYYDPYDRGPNHRYEAPNYVGPSDKYGRPVRGASACIKLCPQDNNPCDPINYKTADGRCNYNRF